MKEAVARILDKFAAEQIGVKLTTYAMLCLRSMVVTEIEKYEGAKGPDDPVDVQ